MQPMIETTETGTRTSCALSAVAGLWLVTELTVTLVDWRWDHLSLH